MRSLRSKSESAPFFGRPFFDKLKVLIEQLDAIFIALGVASSFKHVRNFGDIAATKSKAVYMRDFEVATQSATKIASICETNIACAEICSYHHISPRSEVPIVLSRFLGAWSNLSLRKQPSTFEACAGPEKKRASSEQILLFYYYYYYLLFIVDRYTNYLLCNLLP